jgi:hypothetical protein
MTKTPLPRPAEFEASYTRSERARKARQRKKRLPTPQGPKKRVQAFSGSSQSGHPTPRLRTRVLRGLEKLDSEKTAPNTPGAEKNAYRPSQRPSSKKAHRDVEKKTKKTGEGGMTKTPLPRPASIHFEKRKKIYEFRKKALSTKNSWD